jgi:AcrR family transcriptional regulator
MGDDASELGRARRGRPRDPAVDEAILAAAVDVLGDVGYARLTMEQVAARAGVGKASLYLRWSSKVALVAEAIQQRTGAVPAAPDTGRVRQDMLVFLRALVRSHGAGFVRAATAVSGEVASNPELLEAFRHDVIGTVVDRLRVIVARAVDRGELPETSDVDLLAVLPLALLQHQRLAREARPAADLVERIVDQFYTPAASVPPQRGPTGDER